jgi:hypothetical protein
MLVKRAGALIPWRVTDISFRPYKGMWSFNPSIHYDGFVWRGVLRCSDYAMPDGVAIRSRRAKSGESWTKNAMVIFDPASWKPLEIYKMREHDGLPRESCTSAGYEDVRIFRTDRGGFQGIAASLHLRRDTRHRNQRAEQVLLTFDAAYNIVGAHPIRGVWDKTPQKNWVPFNDCVEPRFLYSIGDGALFDGRGPLKPEEFLVRPSMQTRVITQAPGERARRRASERAVEEGDRRPDRSGQGRNRSDRWEQGPDLTRTQLSCVDLRGGTPLVHVGDDAWLGMGHAMRFIDGLKYYWHVWYLVNARGRLMATSVPMKLAPNGIEFAAGMGIAGDRVVVSFGVDDMECKIGETRLSAVLEVLHKVSDERGQ